MKNRILIPLVGILFISLSGFISNPSDYIHSVYAKDYVSTVCNESLNERFEKQFSGIVKTVEKVDVHYNENAGYYYKVAGISPEGDEVIDYFKTTEEEVAAGIYDYIKLNENTVALAANAVCREDITQLPDWCSQYNEGVVCGRVDDIGLCVYY